MTFKRIVVGIDGSKAGWTAKDYAFELGEKLSVPVLGVHIMDSRLIEESFLEDLVGILGLTHHLGISQKVRDFFEEQASALIEEFLSEGRGKSLKVSSFQTVGIPYQELVHQADPDDLLIIGRRGNRPVKGLFLSSTAEVVSRRSKAPVLLVPEEKRAVKKVCVAYEGSELSKRALLLGIKVAELYGGDLHALYVGDRPPEAPPDVPLSVERGMPEERIVEHCKEKEVDLLVMGAYSKGRLKELFLGSVTSVVMHHIHIPLLLVK
ncbi:MAG: universal stress protein [Aquificaceae bacterium]|nr:universal stress protein [Aquificaceae bacterium]